METIAPEFIIDTKWLFPPKKITQKVGDTSRTSDTSVLMKKKFNLYGLITPDGKDSAEICVCEDYQRVIIYIPLTFRCSFSVDSELRVH